MEDDPAAEKMSDRPVVVVALIGSTFVSSPYEGKGAGPRQVHDGSSGDVAFYRFPTQRSCRFPLLSACDPNKAAAGVCSE